ncbi:hypothetical protein COH20_004729 [Aspergillus flavus]|nr:hypothetical protein AFLA70_189g002311 [Aspergillus flavus AF70]RAQ50193.1 hypothetical protein AFGD_011586 [Aspergillus flavus]RAQ67264.1 hypothetical protein COH20_004729 [Aspergillus flavus]RAQ75687.1 hypothetical protein COH21_007751 [Aspergillus flavus]
MNHPERRRKDPDPREQGRNDAGTQFEFVLEKDQPGIRSHAMRQFWRQKQAIAKEDPSDVTSAGRRLYPRTLMPNDGIQTYSQFEGLKEFRQQMSALQPKDHGAGSANAGKGNAETLGIPAQILSGIRHALEFVNCDPFHTFPVTLTAQHRKLLYHWLSTHTSGMSVALPHAAFDPIREVWLPLDLSNSASFNATMAHAAAHLAYLHGELASPEALRYKTEAISIITKWLDDPEQALRNETLVSVVRLLMFEKYWGIDGQWEVHRDGLQRLINARGGLSALRGDWRVELVVFFAFFIAGSPRCEPTTHVWELSDHFTPTALHPTLQLTVDRHRSKVVESLQIYPAVYDATILLYNSFHQAPEPEILAEPSELSTRRLKCLVFLSVIFQESVYSSVSTLGGGFNIDCSFTNQLVALDESLAKYHHRWQGEVDILHAILFGDFCDLNHRHETPELDFVIRLSDSLGQLSQHARKAIGQCLLNMLLEEK